MAIEGEHDKDEFIRRLNHQSNSFRNNALRYKTALKEIAALSGKTSTEGNIRVIWQIIGIAKKALEK